MMLDEPLTLLRQDPSNLATYLYMENSGAAKRKKPEPKEEAEPIQMSTNKLRLLHTGLLFELLDCLRTGARKRDIATLTKDRLLQCLEIAVNISSDSALLKKNWKELKDSLKERHDSKERRLQNMRATDPCVKDFNFDNSVTSMWKSVPSAEDQQVFFVRVRHALLLEPALEGQRRGCPQAGWRRGGKAA